MSSSMMNNILVLIVAVLVVAAVQQSIATTSVVTDAFIIPRSRQTNRILLGSSSPTNMAKTASNIGQTSSSLSMFWISDAVAESSAPLEAVVAADVADASSATLIDGDPTAFTDSINFFDGPILGMVGVFGIVIFALLAAKSLTDQMDSAIVTVLDEFEKINASTISQGHTSLIQSN